MGEIFPLHFSLLKPPDEEVVKGGDTDAVFFYFGDRNVLYSSFIKSSFPMNEGDKKSKYRFELSRGHNVMCHQFLFHTNYIED